MIKRSKNLYKSGNYGQKQSLMLIQQALGSFNRKEEGKKKNGLFQEDAKQESYGQGTQQSAEKLKDI